MQENAGPFAFLGGAEMQEEIERLIPVLRSYLLHPRATAAGVQALFERHGLRVITEDEGDFLDWCEVREFAEMPVEGTA